MHQIRQWPTLLRDHPAATGAAAAGLLIAALVIVLVIRWTARSIKSSKVTGDQVGTLIAAAIATGVSAQGMWVFFDKSLQLPIPLRVMFFAFLEIMVVSSALRARASQLSGGSTGVDGIAMWVLTCLSAVLAATDAANIGTVLIRLSAPLVAAWGWERSMALEHHRRTGSRAGINWRFTPERLMVRWGLADPVNRTLGDAAAQRRSITVALAADHARTVRDAGASERNLRQAKAKLHKAMRLAVEDGGLVPTEGRTRQAILLDYISILYNTTALIDLEPPNPWTSSDNIDREYRALVSPISVEQPAALEPSLAHNQPPVAEPIPMHNGHTAREPIAAHNGHEHNGHALNGYRLNGYEVNGHEHGNGNGVTIADDLPTAKMPTPEPPAATPPSARRSLNPFPQPIDPEYAATIAQAVRTQGLSTKPLETLTDLYVRVSAGEVPSQVAADLGLPHPTANRALRAVETVQ